MDSVGNIQILISQLETFCGFFPDNDGYLSLINEMDRQEAC